MDFVPIKEYSGTQLPPFTMATIIHYFVTRIACDGKSTNDFKNFEKKSYPLFLDGHVQSITVSSGDKSTIYRANCLPEMKKNVIYNIHLTQNTLSGDIESVNIPPQKLLPQLTESELVETRRIASVRIHVERIIGRLKQYHILNNIPNNMAGVADRIFFVCTIFTNFSKPLVL